MDRYGEIDIEYLLVDSRIYQMLGVDGCCLLRAAKLETILQPGRPDSIGVGFQSVLGNEKLLLIGF